MKTNLCVVMMKGYFTPHFQITNYDPDVKGSGGFRYASATATVFPVEIARRLVKAERRTDKKRGWKFSYRIVRLST